jgi:gamma-glutamylcyclotransferase (GGCT)/AIG2-like uncharacterized protein YtfP
MDGLCNLFVYGTLMSSATQSLGARERARLKREATSLGPAAVEGRLYDLGGYPGVVLAQGSAGLVHGELIKLHDPGTAFAWLDPYEDVHPDGHRDDLYRRVVTIALAGNDRVPCWIYELRSATGLKTLPEGRWPGPQK